MLSKYEFLTKTFLILAFCQSCNKLQHNTKQRLLISCLDFWETAHKIYNASNWSDGRKDEES